MANAINILSKFRAKGIAIALDDSQTNLSITGRLSALTDADKKELVSNKAMLLQFFQEQTASTRSIPRAQNMGERIPLSPNQTQIWVHEQLEGSKNLYTIPALYKYHLPAFYLPLFQEALDHLVRQNEVLRYTFGQEEGNPFQAIGDYQRERQLFFMDLRGAANPDEALREAVESSLAKRFVLEGELPWEITIFQLPGHTYQFFLKIHHLIADGDSLQLLIEKLFEVYTQLAQGQVPATEKGIQYRDYVAWLRDRSHFENAATFWKGQLEGLSEVPQLKADAFGKSALGQDSVNRRLSDSLHARLQAYSKSRQVNVTTLFTLAFGQAMAKRMGSKDIVLGMPAASRTHPQLGKVLGDFVNTLPLRLRFDDSATVGDSLQALQRQFYGILEHQIYPLQYMLEDSRFKANDGGQALFNSVISFPNNQRIDVVDGDIDLRARNAKYDVVCSVLSNESRSLISLDFDATKFQTASIQAIVEETVHLLGQIISGDQQKLGELSAMDAQSRAKVLGFSKGRSFAYPSSKTYSELFEAQAELHPSRRAIVFGSESMTYAELNAAANRLGAYLRDQYGVQKDDLVGIQQEKGLPLLVSMLGILKSGAAFLPIDVNYPQERIDYLREDSSCKLVLDAAEMDRFQGLQDQYDAKNPSIDRKSSDLAYVIYTSGSTGKPKGVMIEHKALLNLCFWHNEHFEVRAEDQATLYASTAFDAFIWEFFPYLLTGACTHLLPEDMRLDVDAMGTYFKENGISISFLPTQIGEQFMLTEHDSLRLLLLGGDRLRSVRPRPYSYVNNYGPTESAVVATSIPVDPDNTLLPIGGPIYNTDIYILDAEGRLAPQGVAGELCIAGASLARGYLNRPALTAEKFVANPFEPGTRMYRTGDLGRWLPDGSIDFIGRKDHQVKVRGHRIELGEIEQALQGHPQVSKAAVLALEHPQRAEKSLVAYLIAEPMPEADLLKAYMKAHLPSYMVPQVFISLDEFPLTTNGKLDRKALPHPDFSEHLTQIDFVAARNNLESELVAIWKEVLGLEQIGIKDHFFELGGNSLGVVKVVNRIKSRLGLDISMKDLFAHPTIAAISERAQGAAFKELSSIQAAPAQEFYPVSEMQKRFWVISQLEDESVYNIPFPWILKGALDAKLLQQSLLDVVARHESLRTLFVEVDGQPMQKILPMAEVRKDLMDYWDPSGDGRKMKLADQIVKKELLTPFDLSVDIPVRARLVKLACQEHLLVLTLDHIVSDGWSVKVVFDEWLAAYSARKSGRPLDLPELEFQFKDYLHWLENDPTQQEKTAADKAYWLSELGKGTPELELPLDFPRHAFKRDYEGSNFYLEIAPKLGQGIKSYTQATDSTLFSFLLTCFNVLLYRFTRQTELAIGTIVSGRDRLELENQVGLYVNTLVLINEIDPLEAFETFFERVHARTIQAFEHQTYPVDLLLDEIALAAQNPSIRLFNVMLAIQNFDVNEETEFEGVAIEQYASQEGQVISKYDMTMDVKEGPNGELWITFEYSTALFKRSSIQAFSEAFERILEQVIRNPSMALSDISIQDAAAVAGTETKKQKLTAPKREKLNFNF